MKDKMVPAKRSSRSIIGLSGKLFCVLFSIIFLYSAAAFSYPVEFTDSRGNDIVISGKPVRVVSLVPGLTEIIFGLGAADSIKAVTYYDTFPPGVSDKAIAGSFFSPSVEVVESVDPDVIFLSDLHVKVKEKFENKKCRLVYLDARTISDIYKNIDLLGRIFDRNEESSKMISGIKKELEVVAEKTVKIPESKRKRVIRLMGRDSMMTPGDDSFQNEYIRLAGCITPELGKKGNVVSITKEEWVKFNPQVIYGCGGDREVEKKFLSQPGWKDVDAVKNGRILYFPCDLTCRASARAGHFVSSLSAAVYEDEFFEKGNQIFKDHVFEARRLDVDLDYVKEARIAYSRIDDFVNKTLVIDFKRPLSVVSTLEGQRKNIESVGNHYSPPPCWGLTHRLGFEKSRELVFDVIGKTTDKASFLFTGADMDNLAVKHERFKDMNVYALVTAGVRGNALRTSVDKGNFYEPGTINIIILSNVKMTPRAMTRAIVSATEAKTAALQDLDIRSSFTPSAHQATGTGTDNIMVVEGEGVGIDNAGGHTKMGELIAKAVYEGVTEAIYRQNELTSKRSVFQRLGERKINVSGLILADECECENGKQDLIRAFDEIILDPKYAGFIEMSFSISDDYERGLVDNLASFERLCNGIAEEIAGKKIKETKNFISDNKEVPCALRMALNGLFNGLYYKTR